jgi:hypothetical protein
MTTPSAEHLGRDRVRSVAPVRVIRAKFGQNYTERIEGWEDP